MAKLIKISNKGRLSAVIVYLFPVLFYFSTATVSAQTDTLQLNCTDRYWYPFIFSEQTKIHGIFIDIVERALANLDIPSRITAVPYKRAINNGRKGKVDGVIGIGFSNELAKVLEYPPDAGAGQASKWQIARVDHVVISHADDGYHFKGDTHSLPSPIRLRQGSLLLQELEDTGVVIDELRDDIQGFRQLSRDGAGVVITTSIYAEKIDNDAAFKGQFRINGRPLASHSYYLAFTRNSDLTKEQKSNIWEEIRKLRSDYIFILQVYSRY